MLLCSENCSIRRFFFIFLFFEISKNIKDKRLKYLKLADNAKNDYIFNVLGILRKLTRIQTPVKDFYDLKMLDRFVSQQFFI